METEVEEVDRALRKSFPGATTELELLDERVTGFLLWEGFDGLEQRDRLQQMKAALVKKIGPDFRSKVSVIFTYTPHELSVIREG